jgi:hypothetical protein
MAKYHRTPEEIPIIGRRLHPLKAGKDVKLTDLQNMLRPGEVPVGYYDGVWKVLAPVLEEQDTIDNFYSQYEEGRFIDMGYYAVPIDKLNAL